MFLFQWRRKVDRGRLISTTEVRPLPCEQRVQTSETEYSVGVGRSPAAASCVRPAGATAHRGPGPRPVAAHRTAHTGTAVSPNATRTSDGPRPRAMDMVMEHAARRADTPHAGSRPPAKGKA